MKTLVIGDLHGKHDVVDLAAKQGLPMIFVGDYLDSWHDTDEDCMLTMTKVIDLIDAGKAQGLLGNHELSYFYASMRCSGYRPGLQNLINAYGIDRILSTLKPYIWSEGFLISHAGVSKKLLDYLNLDLEEYLEKNEFFQIGYARGGRSDSGGLHWCDYNKEFEAISGVKQVFGHTAGSGIRTNDNENYCIDTLDFEYTGLIIDTGKAEHYELV